MDCSICQHGSPLGRISQYTKPFQSNQMHIITFLEEFQASHKLKTYFPWIKCFFDVHCQERIRFMVLEKQSASRYSLHTDFFINRWGTQTSYRLGSAILINAYEPFRKYKWHTQFSLSTVLMMSILLIRYFAVTAAFIFQLEISTSKF